MRRLKHSAAILILLVYLVFLFIGVASAADITVNDVGTSTNSNAWVTIYGFKQGKVFYAAGLYWIFYQPDDNVNAQVYKTSSDGLTWSGTTAVSATGNNYGHSVAYAVSGTQIAYVSETGGNVYYRLGTLLTNGSITWNGAQKSITSGAAGYGYTPAIYFDADGYNWVDYTLSGSTYSFCVKNSVKDGNWTSAPGFPKTLVSTNASQAELAMLSNGDVYAIYSKTDPASNYVFGNYWDAGTSTWGGEHQISSEKMVSSNFIVETNGTKILLVFRHWESGIAEDWYWYYNVWDGAAWDVADTLLEDTNVAIVLWGHAFDGDNSSYIVYPDNPDASHVYYREFNYDTETWQSPVDWYTDPNTIVNAVGYGNVAAGYGNDNLLIVYLTGAGSPYDVRFGGVDFSITSIEIGAWLMRQILSAVVGLMTILLVLRSGNPIAWIFGALLGTSAIMFIQVAI